MRPGEPSRTAVYVALGRAAADRAGTVRGFSDPVALRLLPERWVAALERAARGPPASAEDERFRAFVARLAAWAPLRTLAVDDALQAVLGGDAPVAQVVILGAGLDARAWRLRALAGAVVYEVDHPDTQAYKRPRVEGLREAAREVRFVPVDLEREGLAAALAAAGHDAAAPTAWIWEGVVMYLGAEAIAATLGDVAARSAPGSALLVTYAAPGSSRAAAHVARVGEPFRSAFTRDALAALLGSFGFAVASDEGAADWERTYVDAPARTGQPGSTQRLAVARRGGAALELTPPEAAARPRP